MVLPMAFINSKHTFEHSLQYPQAQSVFYITLIFVFTMTDRESMILALPLDGL